MPNAPTLPSLRMRHETARTGGSAARGALHAYGRKGNPMPNIMLTYRCNLRCPYCFANEFVNGRTDEITPENFERALAFVTARRPVHLGLIGGEPTLHPHFGEFLQRVIEHPRIASATVYTNGIRLNGFEDLLAHPKLSLLVNWNPPGQIGENAFGRIRGNVDTLVFERGMRGRVNLGLNLDGKDFDYGYMVDLLERYGLKKLRISLAVPNFPEGCGADVLEYFRGFKPFLLGLFARMDAIGVLPYYDCNRPPYCIWTPEERQWIEAYVARHSAPGDQESTLVNTKSFCRPVIDILPDLHAVRCFGMSFFEQVDIGRVPSLDELEAHFMRTIDRKAFRVHAAPECDTCPLRRQWLCCQGCMGFKADEIGHERGDSR